MKKLLISFVISLVSTGVVNAQAITDDGSKVGINNPSPSAQLHIGNAAGAQEMRFDGLNTKIRILAHSTAQDAWIQWGKAWTSGSTSDLNFTGIYGVPKFMTIKADGNIAIGAIDPAKKLDVRGNVVIGRIGHSGELLFRRSSDGNMSGKVGFLEAANGSNFQIRSSAGGGFITFATNTNGDGENEKLRITNSGNVGIGTTNPGAKLAVNGRVHAEEVKVDLNVPGPDYVFESNYKLRSLTETADYIKKFKHLPGIPTAQEMEANGINLSDMNMKLLEKVEELTLHLINLNEKIVELQEENKKLILDHNNKKSN